MPGPIEPGERKPSWVPCVHFCMREVVALHDARDAAALAGADHVDALALGEDVDLHLLTDLVLCGILGADPRLVQMPLRRDLGLLEVTEHAASS